MRGLLLPHPRNSAWTEPKKKNQELIVQHLALFYKREQIIEYLGTLMSNARWQFEDLT